jgi:hypothetical protein
MFFACEGAIMTRPANNLFNMVFIIIPALASMTGKNYQKEIASQQKYPYKLHLISLFYYLLHYSGFLYKAKVKSLLHNAI